MNRTRQPRVIFVTGTDTGVGKTLLTGLLLDGLRRKGCHALAMKPFCSGSRADAEFLRAVQEGELTCDEINPFFFAEPVAPLVAARRQRRLLRLPEVLRCIGEVANRCQCLLIEGIGGVMVPLGEGFAVSELLARLRCETIVVARNRLGTINHTLLTVNALKQAGVQRLKIVLMSSPEADPSTGSNRRILAELLSNAPVFLVPYLGRNPEQLGALEAAQKKIKKTLAQILA